MLWFAFNITSSTSSFDCLFENLHWKSITSGTIRRWARFCSSLCQLNMVPYKSRRLFWRFSNETKLFLKHQYLLLVVSVALLKTAVDCFHKNQLLMALKLNLDSCWGIAEITGPYLCKNMFKTELSSF